MSKTLRNDMHIASLKTNNISTPRLIGVNKVRFGLRKLSKSKNDFSHFLKGKAETC
jgi:hypothetical protein